MKFFWYRHRKEVYKTETHKAWIKFQIGRYNFGLRIEKPKW